MTTTLRVGPGSLVFGEGTEEEFAMQIKSATVTPEVEAEDDEEVLSGAIVAGEETHTATLAGNFFQDISADGFTTWTWDNRGVEMPFTYIPNSAAARGITGVCKIRATVIGGDVGTKARADFEFPCVGFPDLVDAPEVP